MSDTIQNYQEKLFSLLSENTTLALATINKNNDAEASSTPYIYHDNAFWVFVSQLSAHTDNLITQKKASILITENHSENIFASTRTSIQCNVKIETDNKEDILDIMTKQLGETVSMLRQLPDFYLIKLEPTAGRFIAGFGKAFEIDFPERKLHHIKLN